MAKGHRKFPRRTRHSTKKLLLQPENQETLATSSSGEGLVTGCSTPKAQRFRIPKITACPLAPKKKPKAVSNYLLQRRRPVTFFRPPDIELFFQFAICGISV